MSQPHDLDAERAILGALLVNPALAPDVFEATTAADFYRDAHARIFEAMRGLVEQNLPIDFVTLKAQFDAKGLAEIGGPIYLSQLADGVPRSTNVGAYCQAVRQAALRRRLQAIASQAIAEAGSVEIDAQEAVQRAEAALYDLGRVSERGELRPMSEILVDTLRDIQQVTDSGRPAFGLLTGIVEIDTLTRGMHPGNLIILAARPGAGKSALALQIAHHAATVGEVTVAFFSLEMSGSEVGERLIGNVGRVDMHRVMSGHATDRDLGRIGGAAGLCGSTRLHIDQTTGLTVPAIRGKARRLQAKHGLGLVVVDYLQLLSSDRRYDSRVVEVGAMSRGLKQLAGELGVPVLALSQLNRASEARTEGKPRLTDLRESGSLEQDANTVWLLHRPEEHQPTPENAGVAEVMIAKNRKGPTGTIRLSWLKEQTRFASWDEVRGAA